MTEKKKKVTLQQIESIHGFDTYEDEVAYVMQAIDEGTLRPCGKKNNGRRPALPATYWKIIQVRENPYKEELLTGLPAMFDPTYYLKNPLQYYDDRELVLALATYLDKNKQDLGRPYSEKQRSFAIWQREKGFEKGLRLRDGTRISADTLLARCGLNRDILNIYHTYEPFPFYSAKTRAPQVVLVVENDDPYSNIVKDMMRGRASLFGVSIGTVMLGHGNGAPGRVKGIAYLEDTYILDPSNTYLYWGDIDYAGFDIYKRVKDLFPYPLHLFKGAYQAMCKSAKRYMASGFSMPPTEAGQRETDLAFLDEEDIDRSFISALLQDRVYIPQEIVVIGGGDVRIP